MRVYIKLQFGYGDNNRYNTIYKWVPVRKNTKIRDAGGGGRGSFKIKLDSFQSFLLFIHQ